MSILILNGSPAGDESITLTGKVEEQNAGAIYGTLTGFSAMKAEQTLNGEFSDEDDISIRKLIFLISLANSIFARLVHPLCPKMLFIP